MPLVRFGFGDDYYTFPDTLQDYRDNFADVVPRTVRLPGMSGGFDQFGDDAAPGQIGKITQRLYLTADDREDMDALRDAVRRIKTWGTKLLWMQPTDPAEGERFCWARMNNVHMPKREQDHTDLFQPVTITWQVADPFWYTRNNEAPFWGNFDWGDGSKWGGSATLQDVSGMTTTLATATNEGNAIALPRLTIYVRAGQTCTNPTIQRIVGAAVVDEVAYTGTLSAGDILEINCRGASVRLNLADAYDDLSYEHPDWMRLLPGENTLRVLLANAGEACKVAARWYDTYV